MSDREPKPFTLPPAYFENMEKIGKMFGTPHERPSGWKFDPTKTFYVGLAIGLVPFVLIMIALFVAGILP